jgi:putative lipoic acid-binding regulatory protein
MKDQKIDEFKEKLEKSYSWPSLYMFKFIVPAGKEQEVRKLFPKNEVIQRPSKNGKYISLTTEIMAGSTDQIISIYLQANRIEGLIAL